VVVVLVLWERRTSHPLLELSFFRSRRFSVAMAGLGLTIFALSGGLFLFTQYLQFCLGYSALQTGLRIAPIAAVLLAVAAVSTTLARYLGSKIVVFSGMVLIALGMAMISTVTLHSTYAHVLPAFLLMGIGSGLSVAPCTDSVMGSVPIDLAGVGSATNSTALQIGGALGVAVLGSLLNTRYQSDIASMLGRSAVAPAVVGAAKSSLGAALQTARHIGGSAGAQLGTAARASFISGMVFAVKIGAAISAVAGLLVLALLPSGAPRQRKRSRV
jgi:Na+/melibiose symporter-like transporter